VDKDKLSAFLKDPLLEELEKKPANSTDRAANRTLSLTRELI
jgi:hypothetical protein